MIFIQKHGLKFKYLFEPVAWLLNNDDKTRLYIRCLIKNPYINIHSSNIQSSRFPLFTDIKIQAQTHLFIERLVV